MLKRFTEPCPLSIRMVAASTWNVLLGYKDITRIFEAALYVVLIHRDNYYALGIDRNSFQSNVERSSAH
jgi:hypothetical protein